MAENDDLSEYVTDLRVFLDAALRMLGERCPDVVGTPWWDGAVEVLDPVNRRAPTFPGQRGPS